VLKMQDFLGSQKGGKEPLEINGCKFCEEIGNEVGKKFTGLSEKGKNAKKNWQFNVSSHFSISSKIRVWG
jgi:hypothetical protein